MKKYLSIILVTLMIVLFAAVPVFAAEKENVSDELGKLSSSQITQLNSFAKQEGSKCGIDIACILAKDGGNLGTIDYAEDFYQKGNFSDDSVVLIYNNGKSEWYILTKGKAVDAITDSETNDLWSIFADKDTYYDSIHAYIAAVTTYFTTSTAPTTAVIPQNRLYPRLVDNAGLLNDSQAAALNAKLDEISERNNCEVAVVTVNSLSGKTATAYADDFYDYNGYGMGENNDGILFLISMGDRSWAITTTGYGIEAFTDDGQEYIMDKVKPMLSNGKYNDAFNEFADLCDKFIIEAKTNKPYDTLHMPFNAMKSILIAIVIGAVVGFLIVSKQKAAHKSVQKEELADYYIVGEPNVQGGNDIFLYTNVTRTQKPKERSNGGSSTHISSSGVSHGGSSGSF